MTETMPSKPLSPTMGRVMVHFPSENTHRAKADPVVERLSFELSQHSRVAGEIIREMQAEIERLATDNARLYETILPNGSHRECPKCYRGEISGCDDGSWIELGSMAGGANQHGMNGWLELIEHEADGTERRREYVATDSPLYGAAPSQAQDGYEADAIGEVNQGKPNG